MKIIIIGNDLDTPQLRRTFEAYSCEMECIASSSFVTFPEDKKLKADAVIVAHDHGGHEVYKNLGCLEEIPFIAAIGAENMVAGCSNLSREENTDCNKYILYGGEQNLNHFVEFIRYKLYGEQKPPVPEYIAFDSIYTRNGQLYQSTQEYLQEWEDGYESYVGMLTLRTRWLSGDLMAEYALKEALNRQGIGVIPVFTTGNPDMELGSLSMDQTIEHFFMENGNLRIDALINFIYYGMALEEGKSLFERAANLYKRLDIPVIRPVQSSYLTNSEWENDASPFKQDVAMCYDMAEMQGAIETVFLGGMKEHKIHDVVPERTEKLAKRIAGWISLRKKPKEEKRIAFLLNNAVCSGVEATLGRASGLDSFESVVRVLKELRTAGYDVGEIPEKGEELRKLFLERKAYSDFRWTSVEDIEACGGTLYAMPACEYQQFFDTLSPKIQQQMEEAWGNVPGEAMVLDGKLVITGMCFGKVLLMIQPKRGCFGAKCTGEVCKILQDPSCPPTHQYLATYYYASEIFGADALIHVGTHGSLEYLPGKANGLGKDCFPDIAVGTKPNLYLFNAGSIASALLAKRRSYATMIDHTPEQEELHVLEENEINALLRALDGGFVYPGAGGSKEDSPETGCNLYGVELDRIPTREAYERGTQAAEDMIVRYLEEEGRYPEQIVLNMISLDIPRTKGEQFSLFLRLAGVRPCWNERGVVTGIELIALEELKRPRMDVAAHISSVLRDTWPDILARMDEAVLLAAMADETPEDNYIIRNLKADGRKCEAAQISRIFGNAPGVFASSIGLAIKASAWKDEKDLGRYFIDASSYAYGKDKYGEKDVTAFLNGIKRTDLTCDIMSLRHTDALKNGYSSRIQGGYALAAKSLGLKRRIHSYMGESTKSGIAVKTLGEHLNDGLKQTFFDEEWKKRHIEQGYDGAADIMCRMQNVFEMQCVNECFANEVLDELVKEYVTDEEMRCFMQECNPYAGEEMARRFLELESRGKWKPSQELLEQLQRAYLKTEANLEDGLCGRGEIQGGSVDIIADGQIPEWKERLNASELEIEKWKKQNY